MSNFLPSCLRVAYLVDIGCPKNVKRDGASYGLVCLYIYNFDPFELGELVLNCAHNVHFRTVAHFILKPNLPVLLFTLSRWKPFELHLCVSHYEMVMEHFVTFLFVVYHLFTAR